PLTGIGTLTPSSQVSVSPASLAFGPQHVTTQSAAQVVTVKNNASAPVTLGTPALSTIGGNNTEFATTGSTCTNGLVLNPGDTCSIPVTFLPTAIGARSTTLTVADNTAGSPHVVPVSGT